MWAAASALASPPAQPTPKDILKATEAAKAGASKAQEMGHRAAEAVDTAFTEIYDELPADALGAKLLAADVFKGSDLLRMHDMCDAA